MVASSPSALTRISYVFRGRTVPRTSDHRKDRPSLKRKRAKAGRSGLRPAAVGFVDHMPSLPMQSSPSLNDSVRPTLHFAERRI